LVQDLLREGCHICAYDPAAMDRAKEVLGTGIEFGQDSYQTAKGSDALLILTEWEEFASLDLERLRSLMKYPIVLDGRNLYDPTEMAKHGFSYHSVGRASASPDDAASSLAKKKERA
jgi:UDPglucose 6-dehydrogenase